VVERAESAGLPANCCAWVKGIYVAALEARDIETMVAVTQGDCSNTHVLIELLRRRGKQVVPFSYPFDRDRALLEGQIARLMEVFGVDESAVEGATERLDRIRTKLVRLDEMTWRESRVSSLENHLWLVSGSDMNGDPDRFEAELDRFLGEVSGRSPRGAAGVRLGYLGVPPIFSDFFEVVESFGAAVVFNEMSRQFAMLEKTGDLVDRYLAYTYPYDVAGRVRDIRVEVERRGLDGLVNYTQSFCFRQMGHPILAEDLSVPLLMLEGDRPGPVDGRTRTRLESFIEMLSARK
jgi:benzoyl-CoA reductase/2-hydroxyglutaryl-CoA dehydratase subunit BcrC/BadD/HgdB